MIGVNGNDKDGGKSGGRGRKDIFLTYFPSFHFFLFLSFSCFFSFFFSFFLFLKGYVHMREIWKNVMNA